MPWEYALLQVGARGSKTKEGKPLIYDPCAFNLLSQARPIYSNRYLSVASCSIKLGPFQFQEFENIM